MGHTAQKGKIKRWGGGVSNQPTDSKEKIDKTLKQMIKININQIGKQKEIYTYQKKKRKNKKKGTKRERCREGERAIKPVNKPINKNIDLKLELQKYKT